MSWGGLLGASGVWVSSMVCWHSGYAWKLLQKWGAKCRELRSGKPSWISPSKVFGSSEGALCALLVLLAFACPALSFLTYLSAHSPLSLFKPISDISEASEARSTCRSVSIAICRTQFRVATAASAEKPL